MSVRSNGSGDNLHVTADLGLATGNFTIAGWVKFAAFNAPFANVLFAHTDGFAEVGIYSTGAPKVTGTATGVSAEIDWTGTPTPAVDTWYYIVLSRSGTGAGGFRLRVFDESGTKIKDLTDALATDFTGNADYFLGQVFAGEWADAEYEAHRMHIGVAWSDAECQAELASYDPVTGGGTIYGNWRLKNVNVDADGINDSGGGAHHFANTGFVNGASTPAPLAGGGEPSPSLRIVQSNLRW